MVVNSFHARPGSAAPLDIGNVHICHICLKQFSRRDLRERHRRRCEKSIGKVIPTKKRSCERCISFKVKCDYEKPSCSRCLNRSVPCEYKLEPRVKLPLNPAFSLGHNTAFSGSLDVFSIVDRQKPEMSSNANVNVNHAIFKQQRASSSTLATPEMAFDLSPTASTDASSLDASLDLGGVSQGFYVPNEMYPRWSQDGGGAHGNGSSSSGGDAGRGSQWDATTVWSDASSNLLDPVMLDDAMLDSSWAATNVLDPTMCMDAYDAGCMLYGQELQPPILMAAHGRPSKHFDKPASMSY